MSGAVGSGRLPLGQIQHDANAHVPTATAAAKSTVSPSFGPAREDDGPLTAAGRCVVLPMQEAAGLPAHAVHQSESRAGQVSS